MDYFPAFLRLNGKACLLVGGGSVAARKAQMLLAAGADLTVVAPDFGARISELAASGRLRQFAREFRASDLDGQWLAVAATNNSDVQKRVYAAANAAGIFCNSVDDSANSSYITPAIVDRSPIVVAISSGGAAPVLARTIRARIEELLPAGLGRLALFARQWREQVQSRIGSLPQRRRYWEQVFAGPVASAIFARRVAEAQRLMTDLLYQNHTGNEPSGEAWLVGAGPGDPGLLTLRALQVMQVADVILHDRLVSDEILDLARRDADRISVGKRPGCKANSQEEINALLVSLVASGKRVCRLKGGDPFIFGRGGEEVEALAAAGLPCQVIPGITAAAGCAAYAGIPLTHRDLSQSVVLVTAHGKDSVDRLDWPSLARDRQTLALYMAVSQFRTVMQNLTAQGRSADTPVAIIERGTTADQRILRGTLGQLPMLAEAHKVSAPALLIIGEVAALGTAAAGSGRASNPSEFEKTPEISAIHRVASK